jgi:hypothetical protein
MRGMASYSDIKTLELYDFYVMNEILAVQGENEHIVSEKEKSKAATK